MDFFDGQTLPVNRGNAECLCFYNIITNKTDRKNKCHGTEATP